MREVTPVVLVPLFVLEKVRASFNRQTDDCDASALPAISQV